MNNSFHFVFSAEKKKLNEKLYINVLAILTCTNRIVNKAFAVFNECGELKTLMPLVNYQQNFKTAEWFPKENKNERKNIEISATKVIPKQ